MNKEPGRLTTPSEETSTSGSPLRFLLVLFALSVPFWLLGFFAEQLAERLPINLPISSLMAVCPLLAALLLVYRERGSQAAVRLIKKAFAFKRIRSLAWYLPSLLIMPTILLLSYIIMMVLKKPLPAPDFSFLTVLIFFLVFFIAAVTEEIGWTGYLYEPLLTKGRFRGIWGTGVFIGAVWGLWHVIPYIQAGNDPGWIVWQVIASILNRMLMVWLYCGSGKNFCTGVLYHMMINVSIFLYPIYGSFYDPALTSGLLGAVVLMVIIISRIGGSPFYGYRKNTG